MSIFNNAKAFTLFTAMVSIIIIGIGVVVVQHISNSEQNYSQVINALYRQQEMDSVKDLIRLDALQTFNVIYRAKFYTYLSDETDPNSVAGQPVELDKDWPEFKQSYINELFYKKTDLSSDIKCTFADWVGNQIISKLADYAGTFKGGQYFFRLYDYAIESDYARNNPNTPHSVMAGEVTLNLSVTQLNKGLCESTKESYNDNFAQQDFIRLLKCGDDQRTCMNGSFYTNIYMNRVQDSTYLNLPRILIKRNIDNSSMDDAILPKNVISLYIPIRLFGIMAFTREKISEIYSTNLNEFKTIEAGHNITFNCSSFDNLDVTKLNELHDQTTSFEETMQQLVTNIKSPNYYDNNFNMRITDVSLAPFDGYVSQSMTLEFEPADGITALEFQKQKILGLRFDVSTVDTDEYYSFGHAPMSFGFYGIKTIEPNPKTKVIVCKCVMDSSTSLSKCEQDYGRSNDSIDYSDYLSRINNNPRQ